MSFSSFMVVVVVVVAHALLLLIACMHACDLLPYVQRVFLGCVVVGTRGHIAVCRANLVLTVII